MERRFVIKEVPPTGAPHDFSITLTELKKRLDHAWGAASKFAPSETWDWDKAIEILLYGEPIILSRAEPVPAKPTRKDWEEWANRFPWVYMSNCTVMGTGYDKGGDRLRQWFLTMPGVPKAVPPAK